MFIGFNLGFFPMQNLGLMGMPRRIYTYAAGQGFDGLNELVTFGAFLFGIGILISILNFFYSLRTEAIAGKNPWNADTLEWSTTSPPQAFGSEHIPLVSSRHPLWDDFDEEADPDNDRVLDWGRLTPTTTVLDAVPVGIATIPEDSLAPLVASLTLFIFFLAMIYQLMWWSLGSLIATFLVGCFWMWPRTEKEVVE